MILFMSVSHSTLAKRTTFAKGSGHARSTARGTVADAPEIAAQGKGTD